MSLSVFISYPSCCCSSSLMFLFPGHVVCQDFTLTWLYVSYLLFNSFLIYLYFGVILTAI